jgi:nitrous oxidase accessory protein NosD
MTLTKRIAAMALAGAATMAVAVAPAAAKKGHVHVVKKGESIQKAIDAAQPGDTIRLQKATYREAIQIDKDRIKLDGRGATLTKPATAPSNTCTAFGDNGQATGICVVGSVSMGAQGPTVNSTVNGVRITNLTVKGFGSNGVMIYGANGTRLTHARLVKNGGYGVFSNTSTRTVYAHDTAKGNGAPAFYVGDSPDAKALIDHVKATGNAGEGILLRDATGGEVRHANLRGNCAGVIVLADAPGPAGNWKIHHNTVKANNRACAGEPDEGEPPVSGIGIALVGAHDTTVEHNVVKGQKSEHPSFTNSGIAVVKGPGGTAPVNDVVKSNTAKQNTPFDLFWDSSGSVTFKSNSCGKSSPAGLCKSGKKNK